MSMTLQRSALDRALRWFRQRGVSPLVVGLAFLLIPAPLLAAELLVPETFATIQEALRCGGQWSVRGGASSASAINTPEPFVVGISSVPASSPPPNCYRQARLDPTHR